MSNETDREPSDVHKLLSYSMRHSVTQKYPSNIYIVKRRIIYRPSKFENEGGFLCSQMIGCR